MSEPTPEHVERARGVENPSPEVELSRRIALEVAQRIAGLHPPVGLMLLRDAAGQQSAVGHWQADRCPAWIAEITEHILRALAEAEARGWKAALEAADKYAPSCGNPHGPSPLYGCRDCDMRGEVLDDMLRALRRPEGV